MQKVAQRRGILDWISEKTDTGGISEVFSGELKKIMEDLRKTDAQVRSLIIGKSIDGEDAPDDSRHLKDLLKSANSLFNRREYISAIVELGKFHDRMKKVTDILNNFKGTIHDVHQDFLFKNLDEDTKKYMFKDIHPRFNKSTAASIVYDITKEAGIMDLYHNLATDRGRALRAWEKRYPKQIGKLKKETESLIKRSERLLNSVTFILKKMSSARNSRAVDDYISLSQKISNDYAGYNTQFENYYRTQVKGFVEKEMMKIPVEVPPEAKPIIPETKPEIIPETKTQEVEKPSSVEKEPSSFFNTLWSGISPASPATNVWQGGPVYPNVPPKNEPTSTLSPASVKSVRENESIRPAIVPTPELKTLYLERAGLGNELKNATPMMKKVIQERINNKDAEIAKVKQELQNKTVEVVSRRGGPSQEIVVDPYGKIASNYNEFLSSLEKLSSENPSILSKYISKYAEMIEKSDPNTANKLMDIVKLIGG